jgi:hypothetical protein
MPQMPGFAVLIADAMPVGSVLDHTSRQPGFRRQQAGPLYPEDRALSDPADGDEHADVPAGDDAMMAPAADRADGDARNGCLTSSAEARTLKLTIS